MYPLNRIVLVLLASISAGTCIDWFGVEWEALKGRFTKGILPSDGFFNLPTTRGEALTSKPKYVEYYNNDAEVNLTLLCLPDDPHVCLLYDKNDNIAGVRIGIIKTEIAENYKNFPYKFDEVPVFKSVNFGKTEIWATDFLFTDPDLLLSGGQGRRTMNVSVEGLWVRLDSGWTKVPRHECDAQAAGWKKQGFIPLMGTHYTRGQTSDCSTFIPLLPLYYRGKLIGIALLAFGKYKPVKRYWFEDVPPISIKHIFPNEYKPCLRSWIAGLHVSSFHLYFVKRPRSILLPISSPSCKK